jgi:hypothetical protein
LDVHENLAAIVAPSAAADYFSIATLEIFKATPNGSGLSPMLNAVPILSNSQFEIFSIATWG